MPIRAAKTLAVRALERVAHLSLAQASSIRECRCRLKQEPRFVVGRLGGDRKRPLERLSAALWPPVVCAGISLITDAARREPTSRRLSVVKPSDNDHRAYKCHVDRLAKLAVR